MVLGPENVLSFWLDELSPRDWYNATGALDDAIRQKFETTWEAAQDGQFSLWMTYPSGTLAYLILTDQMSRNMFRGTPKAFASDQAALAAAKSAIEKGWDLKIAEPARQFFYTPLMHSENQCDQNRCVRLIHERMPECGPDTLVHSQAHREVIRQFGRFPYRNAAMGRANTQAEKAYLAQGGYGMTLRALQSDAAA